MKLKPITPRGPVSKKVLSYIKKLLSSKVTDLSDFKEAKIYTKNLEQTVLSSEEFSKFDPLHGLYAYSQNRLSVLIELVTEVPALRDLTSAYRDAEEEYLPSGPPMSPLSTSYFFCWGSFDLHVGVRKETFCTVVMDVCKALDSDQHLVRMFETMQNSRMGIYVNEGASGNFVCLRELITGKEQQCLSPAGYLGMPGEIWYVRVLPDPTETKRFGYSLIFNTPYICSERRKRKFLPSSECKWLEYFERNLHKTNIRDRTAAYEHIMKYGLERQYWNEYIFEGYAGHTYNMVLLAGFPDIPSSRPHSNVGKDEDRSPL